MDSLRSLLIDLKAAIEDDADLQGFATRLKADEPGSSGTFLVKLGNEFILKNTIAPSLTPFLFICVSNEKGKSEDAPGEMIQRELRIWFGFFDNNVERGTLRSVELQELVALTLDRILGEWYVGSDSGNEYVWSHRIGNLITDQDLNRPLSLSILPVDVTYTLTV